MQKLLLIALLWIIGLTGIGQHSRHLIQLKNKAGSPHQIQQPETFLTERSIERKNRHGIVIDSSDLPLSPNYINQLRQINGVQILALSKWTNQVAIRVSDFSVLQTVQQLPFVSNSRPVAARSTDNRRSNKWTDTIFLAPIFNQLQRTNNEPTDYGMSVEQIKIHRGDFLHKHGFKGDSMSVAVLDAGFFNHDQLPVFDSMRARQQIHDVWDFVEQNNRVSEDHPHGTHCLGILGANAPGQMVGSAPHSRYQLYRTEDIRSEFPIEEFYLLAALERADSIGVDVCSISLGYNTFDDPSFDYSYADLNGQTSISARAVNMAAKKGMLPVVAVGNEGARPWRFLLTPGDADEALSVGAVDSFGNRAYFSSHGPSSDGEIKPTLMSLGESAVIPNEFTGFPQYGSGTSFACPNLAGLAACLWQAFPELNRNQIQSALIESGSQFNQPDSLYGYGIPDMKKAFVSIQQKTAIQSAQFDNCRGEIKLKIKVGSPSSIILERRLEDESTFYRLRRWNFSTTFQWQDLTHTDDLAGTNYSHIDYRFRLEMPEDTSYQLPLQTITPTDCRVVMPSKNDWTIYPNPANQRLRIKLERTNSASLRFMLFDSKGSLMWNKSIYAFAGTDIQSIDLSTLPTGLYHLRMYENGKQVQSKSFLKVNP
jgi:serine protease AprX